jgi:hypothetical protein
MNNLLDTHAFIWFKKEIVNCQTMQEKLLKEMM